MTLEPHIHCAECFREIATKIKCAGGKTKDVAIAFGTQFAVLPRPDGVGILPRQVPLCQECLDRLKKQEQAAATASKIVVPRADVHALRRIQ